MLRDFVLQVKTQTDLNNNNYKPNQTLTGSYNWVSRDRETMGATFTSWMEVAVSRVSLFNGCKIAADSTQGHRHPQVLRERNRLCVAFSGGWRGILPESSSNMFLEASVVGIVTDASS